MLLSADPNMEVEQAPGPPVGTIVDGRYKLLEVAGRGGMGVVYKAQHLNISHIVALKVLLKEADTDDHAFKRFQQEARAASSLKHPNIITIHDFGLHNNSLAYLAMDFLDGRSLFDAIHSVPGLTLERFQHIFTQACDALGHAHKHGVVHRDIKPSNLVLVDRDGDKDFLVIVDFGLVKLTSSDNDQKLTSADMLVGSPLYMSPEQCRGLNVDPRTDIYSLGCVMYEALTASPPLAGDSPLDTLYKHIATMPPPMIEANPACEVPPALEAAIFKALSKDPKQRQQSMQELKRDIVAALATPATVQPPANVLLQSQTSLSQVPVIKPASVIKPRPIGAQPTAGPSGQFRTKQRTSHWLWLGPLLAATAVFGTIIVVLMAQLLKADKSLSEAGKTASQATAHQEAVHVTPPPPAAPPATSHPVAHTPSKAQAIKQIAALEKQANSAYGQEQFQLARQKYSECLALKQATYGTEAKQEVATIAMLIICNDKLGDQDSTVEYLNTFNDVFGAYPNEISSDTPLLCRLAEISSAHNDYQLAVKLMSAAINAHDHSTLVADSESFKLRFQLVDLYLAQNQIDAALEELKIIFSSSQEFPRFHEKARQQILRLLREQGRDAEAIEFMPRMRSPGSQQGRRQQGLWAPRRMRNFFGQQ